MATTAKAFSQKMEGKSKPSSSCKAYNDNTVGKPE
jgi:hypothetical protein